MFPRNTITGANTFNISLNIFLKVLFYPSETQKLSVWSKKSPGVWYWYINHTPLSVPGIHGQFKQGYVLKNWVEGLSDEAFYPWESPKKFDLNRLTLHLSLNKRKFRFIKFFKKISVKWDIIEEAVLALKVDINLKFYLVQQRNRL